MTRLHKETRMRIALSIAVAAIALAAATAPAQASDIKDGTSNTMMLRLLEEQGIGWDYSSTMSKKSS
jgi:hypothetical protein